MVLGLVDDAIVSCIARVVGVSDRDQDWVFLIALDNYGTLVRPGLDKLVVD